MEEHDKHRAAAMTPYDRYSLQQSPLRNDLLRNPETLYQSMAFDVSIIRALGSLQVDVQSAEILDVGCGNGGSVLNFLRLGCKPSSIYGIDRLGERIEEARGRFPNVNFSCGDASAMMYPDARFDIVFESTMFIQMTDQELASRVAKEMLRVLKPQGYILLVDWRYSKPGNSEYLGLSKKRIKALFECGSQTTICRTFRGALVPPVGRFLSKHAPSLYSLVQLTCPVLVGQQTTVLKKDQVSL